MAKTRQVTFILGANIKNFKKGLDSAQQRMRRFGRTMKRTGQNLTRSVSLPLAAAGGAAIKMASDFESALAQTRAQADLTSKEVSFIGDSAKQMARKTGEATDEIIEAYKFTLSAGMDLAESQEIVGAAAEASAAGFGEQKNLVRLATTAMQAYNDDIDSGRQFMDLLVGAAQQMELEVSKLGPALQRNVGIGKELGISLEQLLAGIGSVSEIMGDAQRGGRMFQTMLSKLLQPTAEARANIANLYGSLENFHRTIREDGLLKTMVTLRQRLEEAGGGMEDVFSGQEGLEAALNFTNRAGARTNEILQNMGDTAGTTKSAFDDVSESTEVNFRQALQNLRVTAIELGEILLPLANDILDFANEWVTAFSNLSKETKETGLIVAGVLGASGPILTALGFMLTTLGAISWPVVLGVAGLAAAIAAITSKWDAVVAYFTEGGGAQLWAALKQAAKEVWGALKGLFESLGGLTSSFSENWGADVTGIVTKSVTIIAEAVTKIIDSISLVVNLLRGDWSAAWKNFKDVATSSMKDLEEQMFLSMSSMAQSATAMTNLLTGNFKTAWEQFKFGWGIGANKFTDFLEEQQKKIREQNQQTKEAIQKDGYGAFEPMIQGATDAAVALRNAFLWAQRLHQAGQGGGDSGGRGRFTVGQEDKADAGVKRQDIGGFRFFPGGAMDGFSRKLKKVKGNTDVAKAALEGMTKQARIMGDAFQTSATNAIVSFGETLGNVLAGKTGAEGFFKNLLLVVIDFANKFGKLLVASGVAAKAFQNLLANPIAAIIAGGALIALTTAVRGLLTKGPQTTQVNDALIQSDGSIVEFHRDDNILAMKDFSGLAAPGGGGPSQIIVPVSIDGREVALATAEYNDKVRR